MTSPATETLSLNRAAPLTLFLRRMWALMLRHAYLQIGSWPRFVEMLYWPIINMATWGFTSLYFVTKFSDAAVIAGTLVGSVILVEVFVRTTTNMLLLYLEEIWSRNLGHLFASPIRFLEYAGGVAWVCLIRTLIAMTPAIILAKFLFGFSLSSLGWPGVACIALLAFNGCWYGTMVISLVLRYGLAAEWMGWMATWFLTPLIAPYYPVSILPEPLQYVSYALPPTYVFECIKTLMAQHEFHAELLWKALWLNAIYFVVACSVFYAAYQSARKSGRLLQMGE